MMSHYDFLESAEKWTYRHTLNQISQLFEYRHFWRCNKNNFPRPQNRFLVKSLIKICRKKGYKRQKKDTLF